MTYVRAATRRVELDRATLFITLGFALIAASVLLQRATFSVAAAVAVGMAIAAWHATVLRWPAVVGLLVSIVLFIPGYYSIPINLPFGLELYRLAVAVVLAAWVGSLLVDPRVQLRRSPFQISLLIIVCATFGSIVVNADRVMPLGSAVLKAVTFFLSFVLVHYFILSVVRSRKAIENVAKLLVSGTAAVAVFSIVEQRTQFNVFDHVDQVLPFLQYNGSFGEGDRFGLTRAIGSFGNPIELGVVLVMAIPLGLALGFGSGRRWWIPTVVLAVGVMSTASRTPITALVAAAVVLVWLRPGDVKRLVPFLLPLILVVKLAAPGSIVTLKNSFFPEGGLIAEQSAQYRSADPLLAGGRLLQLGPMLDEASRRPLLGQGFATRQVGFQNPLRNAPILDNQWLGLLLELGAVGIAGWTMLFLGAARRLGRVSRRRAGPEGWLAAGLAASVIGFGVALFTFDGFGFIQATFIFWILISLSGSLLLSDADEAVV
jgi:polysaccharide biosynthesis protein PslJ